MADRASAVNPKILQWARERAGYTVDEVAVRLKKPVVVVRAWEGGTDAPTFRQLEEMADGLYKRPVALFFFPQPPDEPEPGAAFRTLSPTDLERLQPDMRYALREALGYQESLRELTGGRNPATRLITQDFTVEEVPSLDALAAAVREYLGVSLSDQAEWASSEEAFKKWRERIEDAGVFVFKRAFKQKGISGFCLYDQTFPVLMINNSTSHTRQVFSLFHELAHLLYAEGGITLDDTGYISRLTGRNKRIEVACNRFAAELLLPEASFPWSQFKGGNVKQSVVKVAQRFTVSREVVLRRLLDRGLVAEATYAKWTADWNEEFTRSRAVRSGGNYYATQATYLGHSFLRLALSQLHSGRLSLEEAGHHLGVKARNVARLEDFALSAM
jgi:Zn-dependent peptidase ImmA (M78 family)/transcriptional regulator with XRE-family HTH domain